MFIGVMEILGVEALEEKDAEPQARGKESVISHFSIT